MEAWGFAQTILSWFENLPEKDIPPRHIWYDSRKLNQHFEMVKQRREKSPMDEAPEGNLEDAQFGDVTLRNALADRFRDRPSFDDFTVI